MIVFLTIPKELYRSRIRTVFCKPDRGECRNFQTTMLPSPELTDYVQMQTFATDHVFVRQSQN